MKRKLFVFSIDAMVREDVAYMMTKPNFSMIMTNMATDFPKGMRTANISASMSTISSDI